MVENAGAPEPEKQTSEPASPKDVGKLLAVGLAVCCGLPLLLSAGAVAAIGGFLRSPWVIAAGLVLVGAAIAYVQARRRAGRCACDVAEPLPPSESESQHTGG